MKGTKKVTKTGSPTVQDRNTFIILIRMAQIIKEQTQIASNTFEVFDYIL